MNERLQRVKKGLMERHDPNKAIVAYLGIPIEEFDKEDLILILSSMSRSYENRLEEKIKSDQFTSDVTSLTLFRGIQQNVKSAADSMAFNARDWSIDPCDAWLWGMLIGWGDDCLEELRVEHEWPDDGIERLREARRTIEKLK